MKVYGLGVHYSFECSDVVGVFSSPEKAREAYENHSAENQDRALPPLIDLGETGDWTSDHYYIEEWDVDDTQNI